MVELDFLNEAIRIIDSCSRALLDEYSSANIFENASNRLTALLRNVRRMATAYPTVRDMEAILENMIWNIDERKRAVHPTVGFMSAAKISTRGRSLYVISREHLEYLVEAGFTRKQMAEMLHVSDSVVKRRLRQLDIRLRAKYSTISNADLDEKVAAFTSTNSSLGQRMVQGMLRAEGIIVQRQRVIDSLIRTDEASLAMRWCRAIRRRVYRVSGPNALWHIDGNHKLIRWGLVIHGGVDGFSRVAVFLRVATNNRSSTMTEAFMRGTAQYGIPSRVRCDHGLENTGVGAFMLAHRGTNRGSFITGRSVHNQRIERLWRDLFQSCTGVFHRLFHHMETTGILDLSNDLHLWCLHFIFVPRVQQALDQFQAAWNHHKLRTERGRTPTQIFIQGMIHQAGQGHQGVDDLLFEPPLEPLPVSENEYGVEDEGFVPDPSTENNDIVLSGVPAPLSGASLETLIGRFRPLEENALDTSMYRHLVEYCQQRVL